jgi:hypothetical protein
MSHPGARELSLLRVQYLRPLPLKFKVLQTRPSPDARVCSAIITGEVK